MNLMIVFVVAIVYCYPIAITNTDLSQKDLFINQNDLVSKIKQQEIKKITIINIQTSFSDNEQFQSKLFKRLDSVRYFKRVLKQKETFVSPYIDYQPLQLIQGLHNDVALTISTIPMNFQNIKGIEKFAKSKDSILIVLFSKISSNVKLLEEITESTEQQEQDVIAADISSLDDAQPTQNTIYTVTSNQLTGYMIFFVSIFALWIAVQCNAVIQTPERFSKQNYFIGKES